MSSFFSEAMTLAFIVPVPHPTGVIILSASEQGPDPPGRGYGHLRQVIYSCLPEIQLDNVVAHHGAGCVIC